MCNIQTNAQKLAIYAEKHLCLQTAQLSRAYYYQSLPFCIIDAVFSLGVRYGQVEQVVCRVAQVTGWYVFRRHGSKFPAVTKQITVSDLLRQIGEHQDPRETLFNNRGFANPRAQEPNRVSKSDLVCQFSEVLKKNEIETFQDLVKYSDPDALDIRLCALPALNSGIAVRYFRMLSGDKNQVKPDRMIQRFIRDGIGQNLDANAAATLIQETCRILKTQFPSLTPRLLDHEIWKFQRN